MEPFAAAQRIRDALDAKPTASTGRVLFTLDGRDIEDVLHELDRLDKLINNPQTADFMFAVRAEKAHQRIRWGDAHDRGKSAENWFWLVGYLAGKALRAVITGDKDKALHHCVSSAAALSNWFDAIKADKTDSGLGDDRDLQEIERFQGKS
jgi:hypothetical protein